MKSTLLRIGTFKSVHLNHKYTYFPTLPLLHVAFIHDPNFTGRCSTWVILYWEITHNVISLHTKQQGRLFVYLWFAPYPWWSLYWCFHLGDDIQCRSSSGSSSITPLHDAQEASCFLPPQRERQPRGALMGKLWEETRGGWEMSSTATMTKTPKRTCAGPYDSVGLMPCSFVITP